MSLDEFDSGPADSDNRFLERCRDYPFYRYCCSYGFQHLRGPCERTHTDMALSLLSRPPPLASFSQMRDSIGTHQGFSQHYPQRLTAIHVTAIFGLDRLLEIIISKNQSDLEAIDSHGRTALHYAAIEGNQQVLERLLEAGTSIDSTDNLSLPALHHAILHGHHDAMVLLLEKGANLEAVHGSTPLHAACRSGHFKMVEYLLDRGSKMDDRTKFGSTPLHFAADQGQDSCVRAMITRGADPNVVDNVGVSPLHLATAKGFPSAIRVLLDLGADLSISSRKNADTPLHLAIQNHDSKSVLVLIECGALQQLGLVSTFEPSHNSDKTQTTSTEALDRAVKGSSIYTTDDQVARDSIMERIMKAMGSDSEPPQMSAKAYLHKLMTSITQKNHSRDSISDGYQGSTIKPRPPNGCLHLAAAEGQVTTVNFLLAQGFDPAYQLQAEGFTPLAFAVVNNRVELIRALIGTRRVDVNAKFGSQNLMHIVAYNDYREAAELLLEAGASCRCQNHWNDLPLHRAAIAGRDEMVTLLMDKDPKCDVNSANKIGHTAIWLAARFGHKECVEVLLKYGADAKRKNISGSHARLAAEVGRHRDIVALLA